MIITPECGIAIGYPDLSYANSGNTNNAWLFVLELLFKYK